MSRFDETRRFVDQERFQLALLMIEYRDGGLSIRPVLDAMDRLKLIYEEHGWFWEHGIDARLLSNCCDVNAALETKEHE